MMSKKQKRSLPRTELADRLAVIRPSLKVLYMSGYTDNAIVHHGVLDQGTHFIAKPFNSRDLLKKIRRVLDDKVAASPKS